jgi:hypothetical protein
MLHFEKRWDVPNNNAKWPIITCCLHNDAQVEGLPYEIGRLLNTLNCLPGTGRLTVVIDSLRAVHHTLPFENGYVPATVRAAIHNAMLRGGGCEMRLKTPQANFVFGACLGNGVWSGCSEQQVKETLPLVPEEIAAAFPTAGSIEPLTPQTRMKLLAIAARA